MKRSLAPLALLACAAAASAQGPSNPLGFRVRLAYGFSNSFKDDGGNDSSLRGPELAISLPIGKFLGQEILLEPSYFGGGRVISGGDDDADIYRISALMHHTFNQGIGLRGGVGFASSSKARSGNFRNKSDIIFDLGVEIPFKFDRFKQYGPFIDVHAIFSPEDRLGGFFFGVGAKL